MDRCWNSFNSFINLSIIDSQRKHCCILGRKAFTILRSFDLTGNNTFKVYVILNISEVLVIFSQLEMISRDILKIFQI